MFKPNKYAKRLSKTGALPRRFKAKLKDLRENNSGIAAVEFAILSPVMILLYFGLVEISLIIQADKKVSHATNVAGDLATQVSNMDSDSMEDVFEATLATMSLNEENVGRVGAEILSYRMQANGTIEEIGRAQLNTGFVGTAYDPQEIGPRLLTPSSGAVVARIQFNYKSVTYKFVEEMTILEETFVLKPRSSAEIPFSLDGSPGTFTCTSSGSLEVNCT